MNWTAVKNEIAKPAYSGMTDAQIAAALNAMTVSVPAGVIPAYLVINAMVAAEWAALTAQEKQRVQTITGAGQVDTGNANIIAAFGAMFANGTATRTALLALATTTAPWLSVNAGASRIDPGDIAYARTQ